MDHGPVGDGRRGMHRRHLGACTRGAGLAGARPRVGVGRAARRERAGRVADADQGVEDRGDEHPAAHDLSSLRVFGSTGEPWNPEPYRWLSEVVGGGRLPIINISGGTEVGACFITPYPVEEIKVCSLGGASHGMDIDVFDPDGNPVRGKVGELVCKRPWPGMTRGIWGDPERYMETYWSMYPDVWRHGDWALIDDEGDWYLLGRSDDTINVAGKRLGPAEVESVLVSHPAVAESAVVGVPARDEGRGDLVLLRCPPTARRRRRRGGAARAGRDRAGPALQAVARGVRRGAAEDALRQDPAARGAGRRDRGGPGRHVLGREPAGARADPRGARLGGLLGAVRKRRRSGARSPRRSPLRARRHPARCARGVSVVRWNSGMRPCASRQQMVIDGKPAIAAWVASVPMRQTCGCEPSSSHSRTRRWSLRKTSA